MLYRILKADITRLCKKTTTWLTVVLYLLLGYANFLSILSEQPISNPSFVQPSAFEYFVMSQGGGSGFLLIVLPLLVTIGTGDFFIREKHSSMMSYMLMRTTSKSYIINRLISLALSSAFFIFCCQFLLLVLAMVLFPITTPDQNQGMIFYSVNLLMNSPLLYSFLIIFNSCLMAIFFSTFSVIIGIFAKNFYLAIMLPYFLFIVASEILSSFPMIFGVQTLFFHHYSPLNMVGGYVSSHEIGITVPLYWILFIILSMTLAIKLFISRLQKDKILI